MVTSQGESLPWLVMCSFQLACPLFGEFQSSSVPPVINQDIRSLQPFPKMKLKPQLVTPKETVRPLYDPRPPGCSTVSPQNGCLNHVFLLHIFFKSTCHYI
ncbi:hypothetical protein GDO78_023202 [Eleutherodactylus coqui]|uniref:Uncharacterized protein n=1 Tax=Eleutherodactylus coqui TaxID=57060 RepID=A0A8J6EFU7_ELECQ|nr:hypothetical protein GDO78_023202 [Eleutherodactylus coqui]